MTAGPGAARPLLSSGAGQVEHDGLAVAAGVEEDPLLAGGPALRDVAGPEVSVGVASLYENAVPEIAHWLADNRALVVAQPVGTEHADNPSSGSATLYLITTPKVSRALRNCLRAT